MRKPRRRRRAWSYLLTELPPMRPYVAALVDELRQLQLRREALQQLSGKPTDNSGDTYRRRLSRQHAIVDLVTVNREIRGVSRDLRRLGLTSGDWLRGEVLVPCFVDEKDAYFIWNPAWERPSRWRFASEKRERAIPARWFHLVEDPKQRRLVSNAEMSA